MSRRASLFIGGAFLVAAAAGCGGSSPPQAEVPVISAQPASATVAEGGTAAFTVTATSPSGGTLSYEWRKGGVPVVLPGSALATFVVTAVQAGDAGSYDVVVTSTLGGTTASTTSSSATLSVNQAPVISA